MNTLERTRDNIPLMTFEEVVAWNTDTTADFISNVVRTGLQRATLNSIQYMCAERVALWRASQTTEVQAERRERVNAKPSPTPKAKSSAADDLITFYLSAYLHCHGENYPGFIHYENGWFRMNNFGITKFRRANIEEMTRVLYRRADEKRNQKHNPKPVLRPLKPSADEVE